MQAKQIDHYRKRLTELRERLREDVQARVQAVPQQIQTPGEPSDVPTHMADHDAEGLDAEVAVAGVQDRELAEIEAALDRIEQGTFGKCLSCGKQIRAARLEAIPYTPYCIECKSDDESAA